MRQILTVKNVSEVGVSASEGIYENGYWGVNLAFRRPSLKKSAASTKHSKMQAKIRM